MSTNWDDAPTLSDVVHSIVRAPGMVRHDNGVRGGVSDSATLVLHSLFENLTFPQSFFVEIPQKKRSQWQEPRGGPAEVRHNISILMALVKSKWDSPPLLVGP
jgi:hypothetical protein